MANIAELEKIASQVRRDIVRMVHSCQSGHPGGSLGCTEYLIALYFSIMKHDRKFNMKGIEEDLFFISNGHISPVFYSVLARAGYFDVSELATFRKINSRLQGHPATEEGLPGIRMSAGSLGYPTWIPARGESLADTQGNPVGQPHSRDNHCSKLHPTLLGCVVAACFVYVAVIANASTGILPNVPSAMSRCL